MLALFRENTDNQGKVNGKPLQELRTKNVVTLIATACYVIVFATGFLGLLGWVTKLHFLASYQVNYIPMATSTALAFMMISAALFVQALAPVRFVNKIAVFITIIPVTLFAFLVLVEFITGMQLHIEDVFMPATGTFAAPNSGHISPITAACFLLASIATLLLTSSQKRVCLDLVGILASVVNTVSLVVILGYLYGAPLLYGGNITPVAFPTALAFLFLGSGMITGAGTDYLPLRPFTGPSAKARLYRAFIPIPIISIIIYGAFYNITLVYMWINPALLSAVSALFFATATSVVVSRVAQVIGSEMDRSEANRKQAMENLRISEEKFSKAFSASPELIIISTVENDHWIEINDTFVTVVGYNRHEAIGRTSEELKLWPEPEERLAMINTLLLTGTVRNLEASYRIRSGETRVGLFFLETIDLGDRKCMLTVWHDITERKKIEESLRYTNEELEASYEEISATEEELRQKFEELRKTEETLRASEKKFRELFHNANDAIFLHEISAEGIPGQFIEVNNVACRRLGYSREELLEKTPFDIDIKGCLSEINEIVRQFQAGGHVTYEVTHVAKDGDEIPVEVSSHIFNLNESSVALSIARDITERKRAEKRLLNAHQQLLDIIEFLPDATFVIDRNKEIIAWNKAIEEMTGVNKKDMLGNRNCDYNFLFYGDSKQCLIDLIFTVDLKNEQRHEDIGSGEGTLFIEVYVPSLYGGKGAYIWAKASPLFDSNGKLVGAIESIRDISERKAVEEQLQYLSLHDPLTNLYNRAYFEEEIRRLEGGRNNQIGMIVCDVDGLKLINDTLGHDTGDHLLVAAAGVIRESFREGDMVARIGGDEFAVLLPDSDSIAVKNAYHRIQNAVKKHNEVNHELPLSISIGFAIGSEGLTNLADIFKEADNNMYREKLHHSQSARSAIVQTLMKALEARDFITEGHADRLQDLVAELAKAIGLTEREISDLRLLAQFHDIGKVGIPDRILFKPGPLSSEETVEMQRHSEIGFRIAYSAPDLAPIADWILKHHEWWNGKGYPFGLKGEEIPLECRIIAIADAYDAMISDRPYRKALSHVEAMTELQECAGTQFDASLVSKFIHLRF